MRITWMGHGSFRIEIGGQVLLLDPWITGNPVFPEDKADEIIDGATAILLTHGHFDHTADAVEIARKTGAPMLGMYELINHLATDGVEGVGYNRGGTAMVGDVGCTLVAASHSSTIAGDNGPIPTGQECGFMISHAGRTVYAMGDTDIMADWAWMAELHDPDIAIVPIGGFFTMDPTRAAWGLKKFFPNLRGVVPGHYKTFPALAQLADDLVTGIAPVPVHVLDVMGSADL